MDIIDQGLKDCWNIAEAERHQQIFIMSGRVVEGSLPLIPLLDVDKVLDVIEVELGEK